jgi:hypothetical protein
MSDGELSRPEGLRVLDGLDVATDTGSPVVTTLKKYCYDAPKAAGSAAAFASSG